MVSWRLLYKDSNNDNTVLGVLQGDVPTGAYTLKHARWKTRSRATDKLSVAASGEMFGELPVGLSNFGTSEPAVFWQADRFQTPITGVDTSNDTFTVSGDRVTDFEEGGAVDVSGSTGNDGIYKVSGIEDVTYDSGADETTISVVENVSDSTADGDLEGWENIFRGHIESQGGITEGGNHKFVLFDFSHYTGRETVTVSSVTTDIVDAMTEVIPSSYNLQVPDSSNVSYIDSTGTEQTGYAPVDGYTLDDQRKVGYRELTHRYGWVLKFKADKTVRFEPIGFGSSIDTIYSRAEGETTNTQGSVIEWTDERTRKLINTIEVVNDVDGTSYTSGVVENSSSVDEYGTRTPKNGLRLPVGYVQSDAEASRVAENIVKDDANPVEGGKWNVANRYTNNVSNSSFTLKDSTRGIDAVYVAWEQTNFYPESKTGLIFQFESEKDQEAGIRDDIRSEKAQSISSTTEDVGNQSVTTDDALSNTSKTGGVGDSNDRGDDLSNVGKTGGVGDANDRSDDLSNVAKTGGVQNEAIGTVEFSDATISFVGTDISSFTQVGSMDYQGPDDSPAFVNFDVGVDTEEHVRITIEVANDAYYDRTVYLQDTVQNRFQIPIGYHAVDGSIKDGDTVDINMESLGGSNSADGEAVLYAVAEHNHPDDIDTDNQSMGLTDDVDTDNQAMGLTDDIATDDDLHGGGTGDDQHGGSTESNVNVDTSSQTKEDR